MTKIVCSGCGEELDLVVLSFGTRSWDKRTQSYIHTEGDDEGDWQCPKCGAAVSETRYYPPTTGRPFPQTYGDWVNLAESIKQKDPTVSTSWEVSHALNAILEEERGEAEPDADYTADDAKRWLVEKAGELGLK